MVVDACFIASQIDVWTQAYNGPTSRRKYVLNLLNVLHKNVTEEYKTDQFLHVIYWFLIYKSNLGHFFRNEGIFPPSSSSSSPTNFSMHRPRLPARRLQAPPPPGPARVPTGMPACGACSRPLPVRALRGVLGSSRPWAEGMTWSLLYLCNLPHLRLKIQGGGLITRPQWGVAPLRPGPSGLLHKWPIFSRMQTGFTSDWSRKRKWGS